MIIMNLDFIGNKESGSKCTTMLLNQITSGLSQVKKKWLNKFKDSNTKLVKSSLSSLFSSKRLVMILNSIESVVNNN